MKNIRYASDYKPSLPFPAIHSAWYVSNKFSFSNKEKQIWDYSDPKYLQSSTGIESAVLNYVNFPWLFREKVNFLT